MALPAQAAAVNLRVVVRANDLDSFVERYSRFIDGDRIFIFTKSAKNVGDKVRFSLLLATGEAVLHGEGTVTRVQKAGDPTRPPGMELRFRALDDCSQTLVEFLLATRADLSGAEQKPQPPALPPSPLAATLPAVKEEPKKPEPPPPAFAERWADPDDTVPANPFSAVSDGAIEFFVEWSVENSIGPHKEETAHYSNVEMALPRDESTAMVLKKGLPMWAVVLGIGGFGVGIAVGIALGIDHARRPELPPRLVVVAPPAPSPAVAVAPSPPAPTVAVALERVTLSIRSRPSGAVVTLDGEKVGTTPLEVGATRGRHKIALSHERYLTATSEADAPGRLDMPLQRPPATLVVSANVPSATVTVAGTRQGNAPVRLHVRGYEQYKVEVSANGSAPWKKSVYVKAPSTEVRANLPVAKR